MASRKELQACLLFELPPVVAERVIDLYYASGSFDQANTWSSMITNYASDFTPDQQRRILVLMGKNGELTGSYTADAVIKRLRQTKKIPEAEFERVLEDNGLDRFMLKTEDVPAF